MLDFLNREDMIKYCHKIKTVVITSFYDSNPNVLIEALYCGCNVVTTNNVGNHEILNNGYKNSLIINNPNDEKEWKQKIDNSLKQFLGFSGASMETVKNQFIKLLSNIGGKQQAIGIYKINATWDIEDIKRDINIKYKWMDINKIEKIEEHQGRYTNIINNIYLHLFSELVDKLGYQHNHYIFVDETISNPVRMKWKNINIWILKTKEQVMYFNQGKFYFVRGNYPNYYQQLIPINAYSIYYPATSFKYSFNIKTNHKIIRRNLEYKFVKNSHPQYKNYNMVLHHEDKNYHQQFNNQILIPFNKFSLNNIFVNKNLERKYDIIFVAQALQKSKNHQLMFDFIKYCDNKNIDIKIAYVSNKTILKEKYDNFFLPDKSNILVDFYDNLSPEELSEIYNISKVNLLLSSRDCLPRVIIESLNCGCYNLATDLLSDGKKYYDGILGELLRFDYLDVKLISSGILTYLPNDIIFKKIVEKVKTNFNHQLISDESKKYNLDNCVNQIMKHLI